MHHKKFFIVLALIIIVSFNLNAATDIGILEEARPFTLRVGGIFNLYLNAVTTLWDYRSNTNTTSAYLFDQNEYNSHKHLVEPTVGFTFMHAFTIKNLIEFSYEIGLKTPPIYVTEDIYGPAYLLNFGLKKNLFSKIIAMSYKLGWGFQYNAYPGIDFILKNSLIMGTDLEPVNFNLIFSLLNDFTIGIPQQSKYYSIIIPYSPTFSVIPGLELNWSIDLFDFLDLLMGCSAAYEFNYDLYLNRYIQGTFSLTINFAIVVANSESYKNNAKK